MRLPFFASIALASLLGGSALAADVNVSVSIGQPGFFGRLDLGGYPEPSLLFPQPLMISPVDPGRPPLYLRVPDRHAHNWRHYCRRYGACGERVFFVRDDWYRHQYVPRYREMHPMAPAWGGPPRYEPRREQREFIHNPFVEQRRDRHEFRPNERWGERGNDRPRVQGFDPGPDRGHDRGHDRGFDQGFDRGGDRGGDRGHDHGHDRGGDRGFGR